MVYRDLWTGYLPSKSVYRLPDSSGNFAAIVGLKWNCYGLICACPLFCCTNSPLSLHPQFDPEGPDDLGLPTRDTEEFRPFARRLPEFKFWLSCTNAMVIALFMTFFTIFDVPVFWPILVLYFFVLFYVTMKKQIQHMIKHKYVPWSFGKTTYTSAGKVGKDGK